MLQTEVTQAQWMALRETNPTMLPDDPRFVEDDSHPVQNVPWRAAIDYCNVLSIADGLTRAYRVQGTTVLMDPAADGYRLPTEAEWEYAARAGTTTPRYGILDAIAGPLDVRNSGPAPAMRYLPNAWNLFDMLGNAAEWTWDLHGDYVSGEQIDPAGPVLTRLNEGIRVVRGGSWGGADDFLRAAWRDAQREDAPGYCGFRVIRSLPPSSSSIGQASGQ
jgi:formylglycine-generating enzyme required for sulfatase activity